MKQLFFLSLFLGFGVLFSFGQSLVPNVISSGGNYHQNASGSLQWTIGEPIIETFSRPQGILTQGFQQSNYTISLFDSTHIVFFPKFNENQIIIPNFTVTVYPNPASDFINIGINSTEASNTKIELLDFSGKLILKENIIELQHQIDLSSIPQGIYFLRVTNYLSGFYKSFKIEKTYIN